MPPLERLPEFFLTALVILVIPGPSVLFVISRGVAYGRRTALATVVGNSAGAFSQMSLVALGLGTVVERSITAYNVVKLVGAAYLMYLGIKQWRAPPVDLAAVQVQPRSAAGLLTRAMLVSLTNPKTLLFYGAFFPQFLNADRPVAPQAAALSLVFLALALLVDGTWALVAARARPLLARGVRLGRLSGGLLIGAGLGLAFARPK